MDFKKILVVGAGVMGRGIAEVFATSGYKVLLMDITDEIARNGVEGIRKSLERVLDKGEIEGKKVEEILARITPTA